MGRGFGWDLVGLVKGRLVLCGGEWGELRPVDSGMVIARWSGCGVSCGTRGRAL